MNHIYRNVWNDLTRTYVAAAEIVRGRGKKSRSSKGAEAAEAGLAASSLRAETSGAQAPPTAPAPAKRRKLHASLPRPMALEQRFMFDGAAAVDALHTLDIAADLSSHGADTTDTGHQEAADAGSRLFALVDEATSPAALAQARTDAEQLIRTFITSPGAREQMAQVFDGGRGAAAPDARWHAAFDALVAAVERGDSPVQVQLLSAAEMQGALGAFAERGLDGERVIFLNADWLAGGANAKAIELVLAEEFGHAIDDLLNAGVDSTGDEGQAFAGLVAYGDANLAVTRTLQDAGTVQVGGATLAVETAAPYAIAQTHYVPMAEGDVQTSLKAISSSVTGNIQTVIAITATSNGTVVVYDHWEDGYEADIKNPTQSTTKVWTYNGNQWFVDSNGNDTQDGGESAVSGTGIAVSGNSIILSNAVNPTSPTTVDFDGRDKIGSTKAISVTRAGWSITPGTVLAGAVNVIDAGNAGKVYTVPVGQNVETVATGTNKLFEYTSAHIIATQSGTTVTVDKDGNGSTDLTITLNEGQSYLVSGGLNAGAKVSADKGVGVYLIAGDVGSSYENRWFALTPDEQWASSYFAPVSTTLTANPAYVVIYNPDGANIKYETATGSGTITPSGSSGSTWASNSTTKTSYFLMPASAARFYTTDTHTSGALAGTLKKFYAVSVIDADATANQTHDWSYSLVPETYLTDKFVVGWGPGADNVTRSFASSDLNASPVWVTTTADTELYIDSLHVNVRDSTGALVPVERVEGGTRIYAVKRLQSYRLFDDVSSTDKDQTGLTVYTKDGTLITAAWGEDPSIAGAGAPYLDMGTTVTPLPDYVFSKQSREADDGASGTTSGISDEDSQVELGEQIQYTINLTNRAVIDLFNIRIRDKITPDSAATYVANSTRMTITRADGTVLVNNALIPDEADATPFPLLAVGSNGGGYTIADTDPNTSGIQGLQRGDQVTITYRVQVRSDVDAELANAGFVITNDADMTGNGSATPIKTTDNKTPINVNGTDDGLVSLKNSTFTANQGTLQENASLYIEVDDNDANSNSSVQETLTVTVTNTTTSETEQVTLTETGNSTGIFRNTVDLLPTSTTAGGGNDDGTLNITGGQSVKVEYTDPVYGVVFDNPTNPGVVGDADNNIATGNVNTVTATVVVPSKTKILYLSDDGGSGDFSGDLDRNDPRDNRDTSTQSSDALAAGNVVVAASSSQASANATSLTFSHTPGNAANRLLLVAVAVGNTTSSGTPPTVTGVTLGGVAMTAVDSETSGGTGTGGNNVRVYLYRTLNPGSATQNVVVSLSGSGSIVAGAVTFSGVNQDNPLGAVVKKSADNATSNSITISSAADEVIYGIGAWDETGTVTVGAGQTQVISNGAGFVNAAISTEAGGSSVNHSYSSNANQDHVLMGVAVRPANFAVFTQAIDMATPFSIPAGGAVSVVTHVKNESGLAHGSTYSGITAALTYGASGTGTTIANLGSATYSDSDNDGVGTLTWTGTVDALKSLAAGDNVRLVITNNQAGSSFEIDYDSTSAPSRIELPTTTVIQIEDVDATEAGVQEIGFYDDSFENGGKLITNGFVNAGATTYVRVKVSDPFGDYDITSLDLAIDGPGTSGDIGAATPVNVVASGTDGAAYKTFEYKWQTINNIGTYTVTATAKEGYENTITDTATGNLTVQALDLGTPSITEFITGLGGAVAGTNFGPGYNAVLRVTDLDEAGKGTVTAVVNGVTFTLTEVGTTGVFEGALISDNVVLGSGNFDNANFNSLQSGVLTARYVDNGRSPNDPNPSSAGDAGGDDLGDDPSDVSTDTISRPANGLPVARPNYYSTTESATVSGNARTDRDLNATTTTTDDDLADSDPENNPLTVVAVQGASVTSTGTTQVTLASGAILTIDAAGAFTYDPNGVFDYLNGGESATDTFDYTISDGNGGTSTATVTLTINGIDAPTLSINDVVVNEAAGTMTFTVTRTGDLTRATTVNWNTADGTAKAGLDYTAASGLLTFLAGSASESLSVSVTNDTVFEISEAFSIQLSGATNGVITDALGLGTIDDEDSTPDTPANNDKLGDRPVVSIAATDAVAVEDAANNTLVFTVTQSNASNSATDIVVSLNLGTVEAADITSVSYLAADGTTVVPVNLTDLQSGLALTIPATPDGSTPWAPVFTFTVADDAIYEVSETLTMSVALKSTAPAETDATLGTTTSGNGTIYDEDLGAPTTDINSPGSGSNETDTLGDKPDAVDDALSLGLAGSIETNIILRNDGPAPGTQLSIQRIAYVDVFGTSVDKAFGDLTDAPAESGFAKQAVLSDGTLYLNADGETRYDHAGRRFQVTAVNPNGTLEYNPTGNDGGWQTVALNASIIITLDQIESGQLRYTPDANGVEVGAPESTVARVKELDWTTDDFTYTVADAGGLAPDTAKVTYTVAGDAKDDFEDPIDLGEDSDVDGITTKVESVLANRARGLAGIRAETYVLDLANLIGTGAKGESEARIGAAYDGDLNIDRPASIGDGFQNAVTTFSWINNTYFDGANANPLRTDMDIVKSVVALVAEDTPTSKGVPDPAIQLRGVYVPALTQEQIDALAALVQFTPEWSPMGFSAELRADAPDGTVIDMDPNRLGQQWRFTVDISRTGETVDTFMAFYKWIDQATIDAYAAANIPLLDLQGKPVTQVGWVDFTKVEPGVDGVTIGQTGGGGILFLDYTLTDNALGDNNLAVGKLTDPGIPVFFTRTIDVAGKDDVAEGSNAVFTVTMNVPKSAPTEVALTLADGAEPGTTDSLDGQPLDYSPAMEAYYFDDTGERQTLTVVDGKVTLPARVTSFFVSVATVEDTPFEGPETFTLTATLPEGAADTGAATILDDGSGRLYRPDGTPDPQGAPTDDRPLSVNDITVSESSPYAVFTVTGAPGQRVALELQSGTAGVGADTGTALEWFDGNDWQPYTPGNLVPVPEGGTTLLVRVAVVNDNEYESVDGVHERFSLKATNTGGSSATGTAALTDDGSSDRVFRQNDRSGTPATGNADDDRPKPPPPPPPRPPAPAPEAAPPAPAPAPIAPQVQPFNSAVVVTQRTSLPLPERPPIGDILTSASGFRAKVIQAEAPILITDKGMTDQFTDPGRTTTFNLPADAFAHSQADAVLSVQAQLTTGQPLPGWMQFDAQAGTFTVTPPPQAVGTTLEIRITARDTQGREAAAVFKFSVGEGLQEEERVRQQGGTNAPSPLPAAPSAIQGRSSFSDQIRLAAAQRGSLSGLLMRAQADAIDLGRSGALGERLPAQRESATGGLLQRLMAAQAVPQGPGSEPLGAREAEAADDGDIQATTQRDASAPERIVRAAPPGGTTAAGPAS